MISNQVETITNELANSSHPIARAVHKSAHGKCICMGFNKGMKLKEHQAHLPTTLMILNGAVEYYEGENKFVLRGYDQYQIPVDVRHSVVAVEDSMILLMQG